LKVLLNVTEQLTANDVKTTFSPAGGSHGAFGIFKRDLLELTASYQPTSSPTI
jgi:hypothetical protein